MTGMTGVDWPTIQQAAEDVAGVGLASAAAGLLCVRLLARRSMATLLFVVAAVVILSSAVGVEIVAHQMLVSAPDRNVVLVVVVMAALAGFAVALVVGHQVTSASRRLLNAVRDVGSIGYFEPPKARLAAEFETLSDELSTAHEKIAESRARERALEASRRELVAWVSHDLRTPLAGLRAMAEALEDGVVVDFETVTTYHTQIRREADRLSAMIDDLFELARIHAGALRLSRRLVGLDDLVAEALASTEPLARAKGVRLRGSSVRGLPVLVDADEFGRALRNLVTNAIRHTPSDGLVEVQGDVHRGMACVSVVDACGGIPEEALPRVFDVAFRAETARTPGPDNNAGLGLSIARGIVEAHAGQIAVQNMARGCQFVIRLPLARSDAPAEMAPVAGPANGGRLLTNSQGVN
ncbi:MAG TPA: ATP-binding protein [Streptosporangiaceae bacterium]|jgi:signal transduction histidine kinase